MDDSQVQTTNRAETPKKKKSIMLYCTIMKLNILCSG